MSQARTVDQGSVDKGASFHMMPLGRTNWG